MDSATTFYVLGGVLAASAIIVSFLGLRVESFPGRAAPVVFLLFAVLVGAATTFAVRNGQEEEKARAAELSEASEEAEEEEESPVQGGGKAAGGEEAGGEAKPEAGGAKGPGGTLKLAADPTDIAFDTTTLTSKPGEVTIDFSNPAAIEHNVAVEKDGEELGVSETIVEGETSLTVELEPGAYTFLCTVPGHAEAGMEGTLTVR
jgi:plastocyanin